MLEVSADDLQRILTLVESETQKGEGLRHRLLKKIGELQWNMPKKLVQEFIAVSEILVTPPRMSIGKMIVLTGIDKSGKETQAFNPERNERITSICDFLRGKSYKVLEIALPSYKNTFGSLISAYLGKEDSNISIDGDLSDDVGWILWSLDRAQHNCAVEKWLNASPLNVVVSKRWIETNIVYQKAKGVEEKRILFLERNIVKPTYTFVIDVSLEDVLRRMQASRERPDRYETMDFLLKVRENYARLHECYPFGEVLYFDGSGDPERVNQKLLEELNTLGF